MTKKRRFGALFILSFKPWLGNKQKQDIMKTGFLILYGQHFGLHVINFLLETSMVLIYDFRTFCDQTYKVFQNEYTPDVFA